MGKITHADPGISLEKDSEYLSTGHHLDSQGNALEITRAATKIIASYDAPAAVKAGADYVCDGTNDEVDIAAAGANHCLVKLLGKTFNIGGNLDITNYAVEGEWLGNYVGVGTYGTIINIPDPYLITIGQGGYLDKVNINAGVANSRAIITINGDDTGMVHLQELIGKISINATDWTGAAVKFNADATDGGTHRICFVSCDDILASGLEKAVHFYCRATSGTGYIHDVFIKRVQGSCLYGVYEEVVGSGDLGLNHIVQLTGEVGSSRNPILLHLEGIASKFDWVFGYDWPYNNVLIELGATAAKNFIITKKPDGNPTFISDSSTTQDNTIIDVEHSYFPNLASPSLTRMSIAQELSILGNCSALWPFIEQSGTSVADYSPNGRTLTASPTLLSWSTKSTYQGGQTIYTFDGTDEYLWAADNAVFTFGDGATDSAFSVEVNVYLTELRDEVLVAKDDRTTGATQKEWDLYLDSNGYIYFVLYDSTDQTLRIGRYYGTALSLNTWYHITATYDGSSASSGIKIYVNGSQVDNTNFNNGVYVAMGNKTSKVYVGARYGTAAIEFYFKGKMWRPSVTAGAISADNVWNLYQLRKGMLNI